MEISIDNADLLSLVKLEAHFICSFKRMLFGQYLRFDCCINLSWASRQMVYDIWWPDIKKKKRVFLFCLDEKFNFFLPLILMFIFTFFSIFYFYCVCASICEPFDQFRRKILLHTICWNISTCMRIAGERKRATTPSILAPKARQNTQK